MSRFFRLALAAIVALSLAAALVVGCSDDDQAQQQEQAAAEQQQQSESAAPTRSSSTQEQQEQQSQAQAVSGEPLNIVVSTQVIADWVRQIGGDLVEVRALVPAGADAHTLELSVADIRAVAEADLVIINGAGLEASYEDAILENAEHILDLAEAIEDAGFVLAPFSAMAAEHGHDQDEEAHEDDDDHGHEEEEEHEDDHGHEDDDDEMHDDDHGSTEAVGRLLVADALEAHLFVIDLSTEDVDSGLFEIAAPRARVLPSPTHRYGFVLARGPEDGDDRVHIFDGGVFLVKHDDHYDLVSEPVSRHSLEIVEENPIHYVNSHGWTAIFADTSGHAILINEEDLTNTQGDYEPIILEAGPQHGAALVMTDDHVVVTTKNPDDPDDVLPVGVEVWTFDGEVVYDASNSSCPGMHGEAHNEHGAVFGCVGGVLFLHAHDGEYEHEFIANPPEMREDSRIGSAYGHHHVEHFFGKASYFDGQGFADDGIWLIDAAFGEMRQVFSEPSLSLAFSHDGEIFYILGADGVLHAFDAHDGELLDTMELVEPGEAGRAAIIVVGEMLYVADPNSGHVFGVHLTHMEIEEEWEVGGAPSSLAFVGVIGSADAPEAGHDDHDDEHEEGEEHEDDHGHEEDDEHEHEDEEDHEEDDHGHAHDHGDEDPHFWFDTEMAAAAIEAIADELSHLSPEGEDLFNDRLDVYLAEIEAADAEVRALLEGVPDHQRLLVTFHDAFGYFARRYGLEVAGFVVEGPEQGISAGALTELIELIEHEGVETVFHEPQFDSSILDTVAAETGAGRGIIWSQPTDDKPTYIDILVGNAKAIAEQ